MNDKQISIILLEFMNSAIYYGLKRSRVKRKNIIQSIPLRPYI